MAFDIAIAASGIIVGILFGLILQRGRMCFNSAVRDPLVFKDFTMIKAVLLALSLSMIGFAVMVLLNIVTLAPKPLIWPNQIIGGFIFGMGMVLAAACASGVSYKTGEGIMTAFMGLLGLCLGGVTALSGALSGARLYIEGDPAFNLGAVTIGGDYNVWLMLILGIVFTVLMFWKFLIPSYKEWKAEEQGSIVDILFKKGWPWFITGIALAIIQFIAWPLSAAAGRNYPLGITAGWIGVFNSWIGGDMEAVVSLGWLSWAVLGIIVGSFIGAKVAGEYKMSSPKTGKPIFLAFVGGLMLGVGAVFGKGCNIGNLLSGIPMLSLGSILFSACLVAGVWFMAYIIFMWRESDILE